MRLDKTTRLEQEKHLLPILARRLEAADQGGTLRAILENNQRSSSVRTSSRCRGFPVLSTDRILDASNWAGRIEVDLPGRGEHVDKMDRYIEGRMTEMPV